MKKKLHEIKRLRKLVDKFVSESEHEAITNQVLKLKHEGISPATWVMFGIDHGQIFLMDKLIMCKSQIEQETAQKIKAGIEKRFETKDVSFPYSDKVQTFYQISQPVWQQFWKEFGL